MGEEDLGLTPEQIAELLKKDKILRAASDIVGNKANAEQLINKPKYRDSYMDKLSKQGKFELDKTTKFYKNRKSSEN